MNFFKRNRILIAFLLVVTACEEVVDIDLRYAEPKLVVEGVIYKDSVCNVRLTRTADYFSSEEPEIIEDADISISDGSISEQLVYTGNGFYRGSTITGTPGTTYEIEISQGGETFLGSSTMPDGATIFSTHYTRSSEVSILNPEGKLGFTINSKFYDSPAEDNYYMICFRSQGELIEERFFMLTEKGANGGSFDKINDMISFSESIFYDGGIVDVELFTMDEPVYNYFRQLDDIMFWKRRYIPPVPYNPVSNISNGALGYFSAMCYDSETLVLE
ncbi:MAG TPA: DUF4249 domain-containing protein [Bacteroidales bacterium]|nr:DUF4249 domain-containing protein [Bacteroidales bacterium]HRW86745.1 DUF4249 domain-containing protein [Bacteroidales bacterium]